MIKLPLPSVSERHRQLYEILTEVRPANGFYDAAGALLSTESALLRIGDEREYTVALCVEGDVYKVGSIHCSDPSLKNIQITTFDDSPAVRRRKELARKRATMSPEEAKQSEENLRRSWGLLVTAPGAIGTLQEEPQVNHPGVKVT